MSAQYREGKELSVGGEILPFSYWPLRRDTRRWGRHSMLFTSDPWSLIQRSLEARCPSAPDLSAAQSFVRQAREYYSAADSAQNTETKPLLYYYGFLNLAKSLAIVTGRTGIVGRVQHGLSVEDLDANLTNARLKAHATAPNSNAVNAFDELTIAITRTGLLANGATYRAGDLMAQSVFGHRLWVEASRRKERFIGVERIEMRHVKSSNQVWVNLVVPERALVWRHRPNREVLVQGDLSPLFDYVRGAITERDDVPRRIFQQATPTAYGHRPSDDLMSLVDQVKPKLWRSITSTHPFRRYYLYLSEPGEVRLNQLLSIYALMFYLGSMTRYNPPLYESMLNDRYGAFLSEFISSQPSQFLFGIAGEFQQQEVSRAAVV